MGAANRRRPGDPWTLWRQIDATTGDTIAFVVMTGDNVPRPVAVVTIEGRRGLELAGQVQADHAKAGTLRLVADYRDVTVERAIEIFEGTVFVPIDAAGRRVMIDGTFGGGMYVMDPRTRKGGWYLMCGSPFLAPRKKKNGTSELAAQTPLLGGGGFETVATPTAA